MALTIKQISDELKRIVSGVYANVEVVGGDIHPNVTITPARFDARGCDQALPI